jgi:formate dehydrogenase major subunit
MALINITINGQKLQCQAGQTVLQVARANDIDIPTLCDHPAVTPWGGCRMCLVEIEKQRGLQPACTFPVSEGMVVATHSERVVAARKFVLELLFSERVHYCMYCAMSGNEGTTQCELQALAYEHGLTHWRYEPNTSHPWPVDGSRKYFFMDHSRCILCRRCIRACDEVAANHTLGVRERGAKTMVIADIDVPLGESSCVSCGTCLQVCPTGALIDRRSAYMGGTGELQRKQTTCTACSVGCTVEAVYRSNQLLRVEGVWDAANGGLLCVKGRFETAEPKPKRVTGPMIKRDGAWVNATWAEAIELVAGKLKAAANVAGLVSPRATVEALGVFKHLLADVLHSNQIGLLYGAAPTDLGPKASLSEVAGADCVVLVGGDPLDGQKVLGYKVKRAVDLGAALTIVGDGPNALDPWAQKHLPMSELSEVAMVVAAAVRPVVLYAAHLPSEVYSFLRTLHEKARYLPLVEGANAAGAAQMGIKARAVSGDVLYVLAADEVKDGHQLPEAGFTVVQAAYWTPISEQADVVLPALDWAEQQGHIINMEGLSLQVQPFLQPPAGVQADVATLGALATRLREPRLRAREE